MSTYFSGQGINREQDIIEQAFSDPRDGEEKFFIHRPDGSFKLGGMSDLAVLKAANPEFYNTASLSDQMLVTSNQDRAQAGGSMSGYVNNGTYNQSKRGYSHFLMGLDMPEAEAKTAADMTFQEAYADREAASMGGLGGFFPGTPSQLGVDFSYWNGLGGGVITQLDVVENMAGIGVKPGTAAADMVGLADKYASYSPERTAALLTAAVSAGYISQEQADQQGIKAILPLADNQIISSSDAEQVTPEIFVEAQTQANAMGFTDPVTRNAFAFEQAQKRLTALATAVLNGNGDARELANMFKQMSGVIGPDVVQETMAITPDYTFQQDTSKNGWAALPEDYRAGLEYFGFSEETFLQDRLADIPNAYTYIRNAETTLLQMTAENMRDRMLVEGMHNGWSQVTRMFTDTVRSDFWNDPTAKYFTAGTIPVGLTFGLTSKIGGVGAKTLLTNLAIEGAVMGGVEGVIAKQTESLQDFSSGLGDGPMGQWIIDDAESLKQGALYAAMGSVGGVGLGSALNFGAPAISKKFFRTVDSAGNYLDYKANQIISERPGTFGEEASREARIKIALQDATTQERTSLQMTAAALNEETAIRLRAGELQAIEGAREIIPKIVIGGKVSTSLESLLDPASLNRQGLSALEVSEAMVIIAGEIGTEAPIPESQLKSLLNAYIKKAAKSKKVFNNLSPDEARLELLNRGLTKRADAKIKDYLPQANRLSDVEAKKLDVKLKSLTSTTELTNKELNDLVDGVLRSGTTALLKRRQNKLVKALETRVDSAKFLDEFYKESGDALQRASDARMNDDLTGALRVSAAIESIKPEKTIRLIDNLGTTPKRILQYAKSIEEAVAKQEPIEDVKLKFPAEAAATKAINEKGSDVFEFDQVIDSHYNFQDFVDRGGMKDIRAYRKALDTATDLENRFGRFGEEEVSAPALAAARKKLQAAAKKVGIDMEQEEALSRTLALGKRQVNFNKLNATSQSQARLEAIQNLDGIRAGDLSPGSSGVDTKFMETTLEGTALGSKLGRMYSNMATWGMDATRLFNNDNRIIRGVVQTITGNHFAHRTYNSAGQTLSIEGITRGAEQVAASYVALSESLRRRLGGEAYPIFDNVLKDKRMNREFLDDTTLDLTDVDPRLRDAYSQTGGDAALEADLRQANNEFTRISVQVLREADDTGMSFTGIDARTYYPNSVGENVTSEGVQEFTNAFSGIYGKRLLKSGTPLGYDLLAGLGWITLDNKGEYLSNGSVGKASFSIPSYSPFAKFSEEQVQQIIDGGIDALDLLQDAAPTAASSQRSELGGLIRKPADLVAIERGHQIIGNKMDAPVPESTSSNQYSYSAALGVSGSDPVLRDLERYRSNLALYDEDSLDRVAVTQLEAERRVADAEIRLRRRTLDSVTRSRFANDREVNVPRVDLSAEEQVRLVSSDNNYSGLSAGHSSLVQRLDEMLGNGMIDEAAKRIVMAAFVDVDPSKLAGMSFTRLDINRGLRLQGQVEVGSDMDPSGAIIRIGDVNDEVTDRTAKDVAETIVHETAHAAFLSASPRLQKTFQALLEQARAGKNDITNLFDMFNIPTERGLENVHEFVAYLAQFSLVSDKIQIENRSTRTMLRKLKDFFTKLYRNIFIGEGQARWAESAMPGKFGDIERGVKNIFDTIESDDFTDRLIKKFDLDIEDVRVDDFGDETPGIADSRRKEMKKFEDVTADDIVQAQNRLAEKFFAENKGPVALEAFTDVIMDRLFREGWPTDDKGKLLSDDALYAIATGRELSAVKKNIKGRGPGGDKKGKKASSMSAGERDLEFDSLDPEFQVDSAREELLTLIDAGLRSSAADARRAAKVIQDSVKMAQAFERRGLQQGERGAYILTDEQAADIAEEIGMSKSKVLRHNYKNGLLNAENLSKQSDIVSGAVTDEARLASATRVSEDIEIEMEEAVQSLPSVQESIAATSAGEVDAPFPGYTRFTSDELMGIAEESDNVFTFLSRTIQAETDGPGISYNGELSDFYNTVRRTVEPEAPEPEVTVRVEEPEAEAPARAEDAGGEEPPAPPEAPASATPEPEGEGGKKIREMTRKALEQPKKTESAIPDINSEHWLANKRMSLSELYRSAVTGDDLSVIHPDWAKRMADGDIFREGDSILQFIGKRYLARNRTNMKVDVNRSLDMDARKSVVEKLAGANIRRLFTDDDLSDPDFGADLRKLFVSTSNSVDAAVNMSKNTLGAIRVQKLMNEISQMEGFGVYQFFSGAEEALRNIAQRNIRDGGLTESSNDSATQEVDFFMNELLKMFVRSRGSTPQSPARSTTLAKGTRIIRNLAYSVLGPKFALSVLFNESALAPLRTGGLSPMKIAQDAGEMYGSLAKYAYRGVAGNTKIQKHVAKYGINRKMMQNNLEDTAMYIQNTMGTRLNKFMLDDSTSGMDGSVSLTGADRFRKLGEQFKGSFKTAGRGQIMDALEEFTGTMSEASNILSFMEPLINSVKAAGMAEGKQLLFRHYDGLYKVAREIGESGYQGMTDKNLAKVARENGVPKEVANLAARAGLLDHNGKVLLGFKKHLPKEIRLGADPSRGSALNLNDLNDSIFGSENSIKNSFMGTKLSPDIQELIEINRKIVPSVQEFGEFYSLKLSPELRGAERITGDNPLKDLLFVITTYPMAAFNRLVKNGMVAKGPAAVAGIVGAITITEYLNRNLQRILEGSEEARQQSIENLTGLATLDMQTMVDVLATQGLSSPLFGQLGPYVRDFLGPAALKLADSEEKVFKHSPFRSPVIGIAERLYSSTIGQAGKAGSKFAAGEEFSDRDMASLAKSMAFVGDAATPFNSMIPRLISEQLFGMSLNEKMAYMLTGQEQAQRVLHPSYSYPTYDKSVATPFLAASSPSNAPAQVVPKRYPDDLIGEALGESPSAPPPASPKMSDPSSPLQTYVSGLGPGSSSSQLADIFKKNK
jgi:hypothetical protein